MCEQTVEKQNTSQMAEEETQARQDALWKHICRRTEKDENGEPILQVSWPLLPVL
jgi:hypothetical protein